MEITRGVNILRLMAFLAIGSSLVASAIPFVRGDGDPGSFQARTSASVLAETKFRPQRLKDRGSYDEAIRYEAENPVEVHLWPESLSENASFGLIRYRGITRTFLVEPSAESFTVRLDVDADGDLAEESPRSPLRDSETTWLTVEYVLPPASDPFKLAFPVNADGTLRGLAFEFMRTHRSGTLQVGDASIKFMLEGNSGQYNYPSGAVYFDLNGDGVINTTEYSDERFVVSEAHVVLNDRPFEFLVPEDGGHIRLVPGKTAKARPPLNSGSLAPDVRFDTVDGAHSKLSEFRGKVVLLYAWATWCRPCRDELPYLLDLWDACKTNEFDIIGVNKEEPIEIVRPYVVEAGMPWTQAIDLDGEILRTYRVHKMPTLVLIDKDGTILERDLRGLALARRVHEVVECTGNGSLDASKTSPIGE